MTSTDELRRLLDERGVAHSDHYFSTAWRDGHGILHLAGEPMANGLLVVDMLTPEQAITATLGNSMRTAELEELVLDLYADLMEYGCTPNTHKANYKPRFETLGIEMSNSVQIR